MNTKNLFTPFDVRIANRDLAVKPARAQKRGVQHVFTVGRGDDDHAFIGFKAIHLDQQLVQCLFALVIAAAVTGPAVTTHRVNFVDEHNARRVLLGLLEHVAHAAGANTHKHLNKVRAGNGEERHTRLARNRARQKRLTGARWSNQQRTFWNLAAQAREFLRIAQKFDDLFKLFLGLVDACHIIKRDAPVLFGQHLGFGLAKTHRPAFATALHSVHEINPNADQQKERQQRDQKRLEHRLLLLFGPNRNVVFDQKRGDLCIFRLDRHVILIVRPTKANLFAIQRCLRDFAILHGGHKIRIGNLSALQSAAGAVEQVEQRQDQQKQNNPERDIACIAQRKSPTKQGCLDHPQNLSLR